MRFHRQEPFEDDGYMTWALAGRNAQKKSSRRQPDGSFLGFAESWITGSAMKITLVLLAKPRSNNTDIYQFVFAQWPYNGAEYELPDWKLRTLILHSISTTPKLLQISIQISPNRRGRSRTSRISIRHGAGGNCWNLDIGWCFSMTW